MFVFACFQHVIHKINLNNIALLFLLIVYNKTINKTITLLNNIIKKSAIPINSGIAESCIKPLRKRVNGNIS